MAEIDFDKCPLGARIEQKVDNLVRAIKGRGGLCDLVKAQNGRVDSLESTRDKLSGGVKVFSFILGLVILVQAGVNIYMAIKAG